MAVRVADRQVVQTGQDDGIGTDSAAARGGLVNMARQARDRGGDFEIRPVSAGTGTDLVWRVPLGG